VLTVPLTPTVTWETVASITLDPGRWLLIGQGSFATSDISGAQIETLLRLAGDNAASSREAFPYNSLVSVRPFYQIQCTVQSQGQTYLLEAAQNSTNNFLPGLRYGEVRGGSIIAYPL
jgi:hypothetical protein